MRGEIREVPNALLGAESPALKPSFLKALHLGCSPLHFPSFCFWILGFWGFGVLVLFFFFFLGGGGGVWGFRLGCSPYTNSP